MSEFRAIIVPPPIIGMPRLIIGMPPLITGMRRLPIIGVARSLVIGATPRVTGAARRSVSFGESAASGIPLGCRLVELDAARAES